MKTLQRLFLIALPNIIQCLHVRSTLLHCQKNTFTAFFEEIRRAFNFIDSDPHIRVAIIWAEGRMFTAGLDLKEAASLFTESMLASLST